MNVILQNFYCLTAPAVNPSTNHFCTRVNRSNVGTIVSTAAAATSPHLTRKLLEIRAKLKGRVAVALLCANTDTIK